MAKPGNAGSSYRSAAIGRYMVAKEGRSHSSVMTKERVARVEASWKRASEATGEFQGIKEPARHSRTKG